MWYNFSGGAAEARDCANLLGAGPLAPLGAHPCIWGDGRRTPRHAAHAVLRDAAQRGRRAATVRVRRRHPHHSGVPSSGG
eukprot:gene7427-11814_t